MQISWTGIFGAVAALEGLVLVWWAEKIYQVWSRLYLFIATRWPWGVTVDEEEEEAKATPVAPKRARRQPAINARDVCYNLFDAFVKRLKQKLISCKILCVQEFTSC